ncbi:hypothetical protein H6784_00950 [Candidatus Nomurabacteria bacterium]|nr:hypothetical protein [Candidatus Nomurabacteria bacterium]
MLNPQKVRSGIEVFVAVLVANFSSEAVQQQLKRQVQGADQKGEEFEPDTEQAELRVAGNFGLLTGRLQSAYSYYQVNKELECVRMLMMVLRQIWLMGIRANGDTSVICAFCVF